MLEVRSELSHRIAERIHSQGNTADIAGIVFDAVVKSGLNPSHEPPLEVVKTLLVDAFCALKKEVPMVTDTPMLTHLDRMTDSTGLIQHAIYNLPRRESGYTTDDNARALRLCVRLWSRDSEQSLPLLNRISLYLSFLEHARDPVHGFHNFMSYQRNWLDVAGTGDCQGQAVLALAEVLGSDLPDGFRLLARELLDSALPALAELRSIRAQAYIILAWGHLRKAEVPDLKPLEAVAWEASRRLLDCYERSHRPDWPWFESRLTYANAVLPHAMFVAAGCWGSEELQKVAVSTFDFLDRVTTTQDFFTPIGNQDWYPRDEEKSLYDQQPVEASTMGEAALAAFELVGNRKFLETFRRTYNWFHGQNSLQFVLADPLTGGCCDGLQSEGVNRNQGAESTLAWLWAATNHATLLEISDPVTLVPV